MKNYTVENCFKCNPIGNCPFAEIYTPDEAWFCRLNPDIKIHVDKYQPMKNCPLKDEPVVFSNPLKPFIDREPIV